MFCAWALALVLVMGGCDRVWNLEGVEPPTADAAEHDGPDPDPDAPLTTTFGQVIEVFELSTTATEDDPTVTDDLLDIYYNSYRTDGGSGGGDIWHASRSSVTAAWGTLSPVAPLNTAALDNTPRISGDGLSIFMARTVGGNREILLTTRPARSADAWSTPMGVPELESTADESEAMLTADGLAVYFSTTRDGTKDLYFATRTSPAGSWSPPLPVPGANGAFDEDSPYTRDGLTIYFSSDRPGSMGETNIWRATRESTSEPFGTPEPVEELNSDKREEDPWLSPDGKTIWFASARSGDVFNIFTATRPSI
jgi:hypothetical protein